MKSAIVTSLRARNCGMAGFLSDIRRAPGPPFHKPSSLFFSFPLCFPRGSFFFAVLSHILPTSGHFPFLSPGRILRLTYLFNPSLSLSHQAFSCAGLRSSRNKRSGMSWAMMWPPSCHVALLLSTATQKMTLLSLMRTTGRINSYCCPPFFFPSYLPSLMPTPTGPMGEKREEKKNFKGPKPSLKQPKIYPSASSKSTRISQLPLVVRRQGPLRVRI